MVQANKQLIKWLIQRTVLFAIAVPLVLPIGGCAPFPSQTADVEDTTRDRLGVRSVRAACYKTKLPGFNASLRGDIFREAGLAAANRAYNLWGPKTTKSPPVQPQQCSGSKSTYPAFDASAYYGTLTSKSAFLQMINLNCGAGVGPDAQFFSMGGASIYYRNCAGGQGNGYVYYWGNGNGNKTQCFGASYPEMAHISGQVSVAQMQEAYTNGIRMVDDKALARGNIMAALLLAESYRDHLVILENYMLIDLAAAGRISTEQIVSGRCVANARNCQNKSVKQNGQHPIAWGGAQADMMVGGWGYASGANSDFGREFEAKLTLEWLTLKKLVEKHRTNDCRANQTLSDLPGQQQTLLINLFSRLYPVPRY